MLQINCTLRMIKTDVFSVRGPVDAADLCTLTSPVPAKEVLCRRRWMKWFLFWVLLKDKGEKRKRHWFVFGCLDALTHNLIYGTSNRKSNDRKNAIYLFNSSVIVDAGFSSAGQRKKCSEERSITSLFIYSFQTQYLSFKLSTTTTSFIPNKKEESQTIICPPPCSAGGVMGRSSM